MTEMKSFKMNKLLKTLIAGVSALTMCISAMPLSANADEIDVNALQEEFNEVQSSNPDYMEYTYYDLESGTASNLDIDNNEEDLQEYFNAQEQFDNFISTCSIAAGNSNGLHVMTETDNKVGWLTANNGGIAGTGFLIGDDLVLTAAHCLMNAKTGSLYYDLSTVGFSAGVYGGAELISSKSKIDGVFIPNKFSQNGKGNYKYDYAVIKLRDSIGKYPSIGYYDIGIPTSASVGRSVTIKGYGYDENINPNYEYPLYSNGVLVSITAEKNNDRIEITCAATPGMSGGPLIDNTNNTVIGITSSIAGANVTRCTKIIGSIYRFTMVDFDKAVNMPLE